MGNEVQTKSSSPTATHAITHAPANLLQRKCACGGDHGISGECEGCRNKRLGVVQRLAVNTSQVPSVPPIVHEVLRSPGQPLDMETRAYMEPRFGHDFSHVRVHTDVKANNSAQAVNALAYTVGNNVVFGTGHYRPSTGSGQKILSHELTHVIQQGNHTESHASLKVGEAQNRFEQEADRVSGQVVHGESVSVPDIQAEAVVQRTLGDGHDLTSPRFSRLLDLEAAFDDETVIRNGSTGRGVQAIQQALYDLGFPLPTSGADGQFGPETAAAVRAFQAANPPLAVDGQVGDETMTVLNDRFGAPVLPSSATLSAPWTATCVQSVLCPWSPHTIDVLRTRILLKSFDSISWADEEWNGAAWVPAPFPGGGYNTGTEIGVLNSSCEDMSETLYHEVLHAEQPSRHTTTLQKESYAYRIGEEFSIAMGLSGRPSLRSTDAQGREFADPARVGTFVATRYPSVPTGGGGDEIIGRGVALGEVRVRRADGSIYVRPAAIGEKVPGPMTVVREVVHPTAGWTCP